MNTNIYRNLLAQFNKLFVHNRQGSYRTKHRYAEAFKRFLVFLAEVFRLERIANIAPKHIFAYVDKLVQGGKSVAYIKTELAAIRFWHDQIPNSKYRELPDNKTLRLARQKYGGVNRTWSQREFNLAVAKASLLNRDDYVTLFCLARYHVSNMCRFLGVSRSGYYAWRIRKSRPDQDLPIAELIKSCQEQTKSTYGYRRVKHIL